MSSRTDESLLVEYVRTGSHTAFRELTLRYGNLVYSVCMRHLRKTELAEDAAQAVFVLLAEKAPKIQVRTTLVPWLLATSKLVCRDVSRSERRRTKREVPLDENIESSNPPEDLALLQALERLKSPEREAVVLRFFQGLSLADVGRAQGISEDAARMRVQRGLGRLRVEFAPSITIPPALLDRLANPRHCSQLSQSIARHLRPPMPVPLTATMTCGVAAILLVSAARVQRLSPAANATKTATVPAWPPNRPLALMQDRALTKTPIGKLDKPFTLVYKVTYTDVRTQAMKRYETELSRKSLQDRLDRDEITKQEMDSAIAKAAAEDAVRQTEGKLTISSDGVSLLVESESAGGGSINVTLIRGGRTYTFSANPAIRAGRYEGVVPYQLSNLPFVGPEFPNIPIRQGDKVLDLLAAPRRETEGQLNRLEYLPGTIFTNPDGSVKQVRQGNPGRFDTFDLSSHICFTGERLASRILWTKNMFWHGYPDQGKPQSRTDYRLLACSPESPPPAVFSPENYARDGERVQVNFTGAQHAVFQYERANGSFDDQAAAAKLSSNR